MRHLALLARAPSAVGKTRLTSGLPEFRARELREALFLDTLDVRAVAAHPHHRVRHARRSSRRTARAGWRQRRRWRRPRAISARACTPRVPACSSRARRHVVLIGSDLPSLPPSHISRRVRGARGWCGRGAGAGGRWRLLPDWVVAADTCGVRRHLMGKWSRPTGRRGRSRLASACGSARSPRGTTSTCRTIWSACHRAISLHRGCARGWRKVDP